MSIHKSTKCYGHEIGLSCAFRQWRASSHCNKIHGYALSFKFVFASWDLDDKGWVVDFGGLKSLKNRLETDFDHKLVVAADDPKLEIFKRLHEQGIADVLVFPDGVGCERFAERAYHIAAQWLNENGYPNVWLESCEVKEHGANGAIYMKEENA